MKGLQLSQGFSGACLLTGFFSVKFLAELQALLQQLVLGVLVQATVLFKHVILPQFINTGCIDRVMNKRDNIKALSFIAQLKLYKVLKEKESFSSSYFFLNPSSSYIVSKRCHKILR